MPDYRLDENSVHTDWDRDRDPALVVEPGATVGVDCLDANGGRISRDATADDLADTPFVGHHLTGPIEIEGAEPGDTLQVDILDVEHKGWGYTMIRPGEGGDGPGLLLQEFPDPAIHVWDLEDDIGHSLDGIEVPLDPFPGVVGVAPAEPGSHSTTPPRSVGGNLDVKHLTAGATVYLPVATEGALFSIGDGHAAQGDGEVCVTAIEAPISATVRLSLADRGVGGPEFYTTGPFTPGDGGPAYATTGVEYGLAPEEAYLLCSVVADLRINQVVNAPNWTVSA